MANTPNVVDGEVRAVETPESVKQALRDMMTTLTTDDKTYRLVSDYYKGNQQAPHVPATARIEVKEIAKRAVMNLIPLLVSIPAQICFVDGYRVGEDLAPKEWQVWEDSGMAAKQTIAYKAALKFGNSFLALEDAHTDKPSIKLLSTKNTVAFYHDPVNDRFPAYAMTIRYRPSGETPGLVVYYDDDAVTYFDWFDAGASQDQEFVNPRVYRHGLGHCPVKRLVVDMDDDGGVSGMIEPMIPMQDRINQTSFDLLVTQTFSSFKVRWAAGMLGDPVYDEDPETGELVPRQDSDGNQIYRPIPIDQSTWVTTDDPQARVGTLDETPLEGFLAAFELAVKHFAVRGQLPPHTLLGNMSNINADTLVAAMSQTMRLAHVLKVSWGQAIVDLMGLAGIAIGSVESLDGYDGEVRWRDMSDNTLAAVVDALGKAAQMLDIPKKSLWNRYPGVTQGEVLEWRKAHEEQLSEEMLNEQVTPQGSVAREGAQATPAPVPTPLEAFGPAAGA